MLTPCHDRQPVQAHTYTVQIREGGDANVWKCGRCGWVVAWDVGDEADAYVEGERLFQQRKREDGT